MNVVKKILHSCQICDKSIAWDLQSIKDHLGHKHQKDVLEYYQEFIRNNPEQLGDEGIHVDIKVKFRMLETMMQFLTLHTFVAARWKSNEENSDKMGQQMPDAMPILQ